jgi:hypothetical protein
LLVGTEGAGEQAERVQLLQPLTIENVGLAARNVLHVLCVHQVDVEPTKLEDVVERNPVNAGGLHCYGIDATGRQPVGERVKIIGKRREPANRPRVAVRRHGDPMFVRTDVDCGGVEVNGWQRIGETSLLWLPLRHALPSLMKWMEAGSEGRDASNLLNGVKPPKRLATNVVDAAPRDHPNLRAWIAPVAARS